MRGLVSREPRGVPVCAKNNEEECTTVEWEECKDVVLESCKPFTLYTPYQIFHHILMCFRENGFEEPSKNEFYEIYDDTLHKFTQS